VVQERTNVAQHSAPHDKERLEALRNANNGSLSSSEKDELIAAITSDKAEILENISELEEQQQVKQSAIEYALNFMHDVQRLWLDADPDLKIRFQKMIFPEGLTFGTSTLTFGTSTISPLYTYAPIKKDLSVKEKSLLVSLTGLEWNTLYESLIKLDKQLDDIGLEVVND
jgi:predicted glycosyl hydrolase (DUF1957 family)